MHFRFCCTCDEEDKPSNVRNSENPVHLSETSNTAVPATRPKVITQQPKHVPEPIQLDRITEVSVEGSSVQIREDEDQPIPIRQSTPQEPSSTQGQPIPSPPMPQPKITETQANSTALETTEALQAPKPQSTNVEELYTKLINLIQADRFKENHIPPVTQSHQPPNITAETMIGENKLAMSQIVPELFQCSFKGHQFYIIQGNIQDCNSVLDEADKEAIQVAYARILEAMTQGIKELRGGVNAFQGQEAWIPPPGSSINTNYTTRRGAEAKMTFIAIGKGHFRSTYEGREFAILNGRLVETDGSFDDEDRQLIMQTYRNTIVGMEQGLHNMLAMQTRAMGGTTGQNTAGSYAQAGTLATGRETLKRMRSVNHGKRISLLESGLIAQPRQPVMVIEDISDEKPKIPKYFDEIDGSKLGEPVLQKTTFTPQAVIYDDPKTYEAQDKNELPLVKPLDEYIISVDENFISSENRYHFHKARPKRVIRPKLNPSEKFRLASPESYSHFEAECLKLHNQYRKMHGVPPLVHNEFLAQVAKEWAEHLALKDAFYHRPNNEYGENLYYVEGTSCRAQMAVRAWYNEIDLYDYDNPKFSREVGHFTQLVWKDTREVGTGVAQIGDKVWVCCNYHPPGNYLDKLNDEFVPRPLMKRFK